MDDYDIEFSKMINLNGNNIGPENFFMKPEQIIIDSSFILVFDSKTLKKFHIFDYDLNLLNSYITQGKGPNELLSAKLSEQSFIENGYVVFFDDYQNTLGKFKFDLYNDQISLEKINVPENVNNIQNILLIDSTRYVSRGCLDLGKMALFNIKSKTVTFSKFYPELKIDQGNRYFYEDYGGELSFNDQNKLIVSSNRFFNQLEIYNLDLEMIKEIKPSKLYNAFDKKKRYYFYNAIYSTDKYIYASYLNISYKELKPGNIDKIHTKIQIFTWEGVPAAVLNLDRLTGYFAVDDNDKYLICIDETNFEKPFVKYSIPEI